jgi:Uma2 family endonuclease
MQPEPKNIITEEEYLEMERNSEAKHEYYDGEIFAMAGASERHNLIVANVIGELRNKLKKSPCRVYPSDMRLKIEETGLYTYPDVMVICGETKFLDNRNDTVLNPEIIIEVLSESTERYDRGKKFESYRKLLSLKEYVLISQDIKKIEKFYRTQNQKWIYSETEESRPAMLLESLNCELTHDEIYDKLVLTTPPPGGES